MSYKGFIQATLSEFGFAGVTDFSHAIFHMKFPIFGLMLATLLTTTQSFINHYIYTPAQGIAILVGITFVDVMLGVAKSVKDGTGITGTRLARAFIRMIVQILFVGMFFEMSQVWNGMITSWMVDALLILFTLSTFWSAIKNAKEIGMITEDQYAILEGIIGLKRIFNKFKKKE
jgi:hypothetical protein